MLVPYMQSIGPLTRMHWSLYPFKVRSDRNSLPKYFFHVGFKSRILQTLYRTHNVLKYKGKFWSLIRKALFPFLVCIDPLAPLMLGRTGIPYPNTLVMAALKREMLHPFYWSISRLDRPLYSLIPFIPWFEYIDPLTRILWSWRH